MEAQAVTAVIMDEKATIQVTAPSNLEAGYRFQVQDANRSLCVQVPAGGVRQGQTFEALIISETPIRSHNIPSGQWRDSICNCFHHGLCHPSLICMCCCFTCAAAQVLTRLRLDLCGRTTHGREPRMSAFRAMILLTMAYAVFSNVLYTVIAIQSERDAWDPKGFLVADVLVLRILRTVGTWVFFLFGILVVWRVRRYVRLRYGIPERFPCEDVCCSFCCANLVVGQLSRHTADFEKYDAQICSDTGLVADAPEVV